jgi:hypothetical protein
MKTITGIFQAFPQAEAALTALRNAGFDEEQLNILTPSSPEEQIHSVPVTEAEHAGVGRALGGLIGGTGALSLATMFIPGVGPVMAAGMVAAGLVGGAAGVAIGGAVEDATTEGLDADDIFPVEHALRAGNTAVIINAHDEKQFERARDIIHENGGALLRDVRDHWWNEQRTVEHPQYQGNFLLDEPLFRRGFEAALAPPCRGRVLEDCQDQLRPRYGNEVGDAAFRRGFERGQAMHRQLAQERPPRAA